MLWIKKLFVFWHNMNNAAVIYVYTIWTHTHIRLTALFPGLPRWAGTRKVEPIWILLKQEIVSGCGISWARCKSASCSRQITTPASHHSVFYRPDALPAAQPTASKHWRHKIMAHHCKPHLKVLYSHNLHFYHCSTKIEKFRKGVNNIKLRSAFFCWHRYVLYVLW